MTVTSGGPRLVSLDSGDFEQGTTFVFVQVEEVQIVRGLYGRVP